MTLTPLQLEELERLAKAATQGEWRYYKPPGYAFDQVYAIGKDGSRIPIVDCDVLNDAQLGNSEFIAAANPQTILTLLSMIREAKNEGLEEAARRMEQIHGKCRDATEIRDLKEVHNA